MMTLGLILISCMYFIKAGMLASEVSAPRIMGSEARDRADAVKAVTILTSLGVGIFLLYAAMSR